MNKYVKCVRSAGQPRLTTGVVYEVVLDVFHASRPGKEGTNDGYLVKEVGDNKAIPYVYNRDRFEDFDPSDQEEDDNDTEY